MQGPPDDVPKVFVGMSPEVTRKARVEGHRHELGLEDIIRREVACRYDGSPQRADALTGGTRTIETAPQMGACLSEQIDGGRGRDRDAHQPGLLL
jgi:hypothetical protein